MLENSYIEHIKPISKQYIKYIRQLNCKKYRHKYNAFVLEGAKSVQQLLTSDYEVELLLATPSFISKNRSLFQNKNVVTFQVSEQLLPRLGIFQSNNAILAVAKKKAQNIIFPTVEDNITLVLDSICNPGNFGTIIRIADWYGIPHIICSNNTVELYNSKVLHASMGAFLNIGICYTELNDYLQHVNLPILGAATTGINLHKIKLPRSAVIIIGNESQGISNTLLPYIQQKIGIPCYGKGESLNVAIATAVICDNWRQQHLIENVKK